MAIGAIQLPEIDLVAEVPTQSYSATYPQIDFEFEIPEWVRTVEEGEFRTTAVPGRTVRMYLLRQVYVCDEGVVFSESGKVYEFSARQYSPEEIALIHRAVQQSLFDGQVEIQSTATVLCQRRGSAVYGHLLVDILPLAFMALQHVDSSIIAHAVFMLLRTGTAIDTIAIDWLGRAGITQDRIAWTTGGVLFCERLIVVDGMSEHGKYISPHVVECHEMVAAGVQGRGWARLFVPRRGYGREIKNEQELTMIAHGEGYHIFDPGPLSLTEQISAFRNAERIVGAIGSGLANALYAPREASLTVLSPFLMPDTFYWHLCQVKGLHYRGMRCKEAAGPPSTTWPPWSSDFVVDTSAFRAILGAGT